MFSCYKEARTFLWEEIKEKQFLGCFSERTAVFRCKYAKFNKCFLHALEVRIYDHPAPFMRDIVFLCWAWFT